MIYLLAFIVLFACVGLLAVGLILKGRPLEKRCSSSPDEQCTCKKEGDCDNTPPSGSIH